MLDPEENAGDGEEPTLPAHAETLEQLYSHRDALIAYLVRKFHFSTEVAEDLFSELVLKIASRDEDGTRILCKTYFLNALRNMALNFIRDNSRRAASLAREGMPRDSLHTSPLLAHAMGAAFEHLTPTQQELSLLLHKGLGTAEMADQLGIKVRAVQKRIEGLRDRLRELGLDSIDF